MLQNECNKASSHWEVDRHSSGQVFRPYYVVVLREKRTGNSIVKASSTDSETVAILVEKLRKDLTELSNQEFIGKHILSEAA